MYRHVQIRLLHHLVTLSCTVISSVEFSMLVHASPEVQYCSDYFSLKKISHFHLTDLNLQSLCLLSTHSIDLCVSVCVCVSSGVFAGSHQRISAVAPPWKLLVPVLTTNTPKATQGEGECVFSLTLLILPASG